MKDMLITPLLLVQVVWEKGWVMRFAAALAIVVVGCVAAAELFTIVDTSWGI